MTNKDFLDQFSQRLNNVLGEGAGALGTELRQQVHAAAQSAFQKMDLVTREEFDAQKAVLLRTREKLEALETQLAELEARLENGGDK